MTDLQMWKLALLMALHPFLCKEGFRFPENCVSIRSLFPGVCQTSQKRKESLDKDSPHKERYLGRNYCSLDMCPKPQQMAATRLAFALCQTLCCVFYIIHTFHLIPKAVHWVNFIIITLQVMQLRSRRVQQLARGHTAKEQRAALVQTQTCLTLGSLCLSPRLHHLHCRWKSTKL